MTINGILLEQNMKSPMKRELTLDRLRMSAQTMILQSNWNEVGVQDIAKLANVSIGTFYNYFDSKDAALDDLKKVLSDVLYHDLDALLKVEMDPVSQLTLLIKYFFELANSKAVWAQYILGGTEFSDRLEPGVDQLLSPILQAGKAKGLFSIEVDEVVVDFVEKGMFGLLRQALENQDRGQEIAVSCAELVLRLVGVPPTISKDAAKKVCPCTPLYTLPVSVLSLNQTKNDYA
jgi:AcrR family transcriptional regulator